MDRCALKMTVKDISQGLVTILGIIIVGIFGIVLATKAAELAGYVSGWLGHNQTMLNIFGGLIRPVYDPDTTGSFALMIISMVAFLLILLCIFCVSAYHENVEKCNKIREKKKEEESNG